MFRSYLEEIEKQAQNLLYDSWSNPDLDEYFQDALIALTHITTRLINKVKKVEDKSEREKGAD